MGLFDVPGGGGLFGGGGFSGGGIGSSANTTTSTTDNKNNATSGDNSSVYDTRGGSLAFNVTDGGIASNAFDFAAHAFDFASQVNDAAAHNLANGTAAVLDKVTLDSGQRIQAITDTVGKYALYAAAIFAAVMIFRKAK